ncbi:hypothetical protein [Gimesia fumaroli]|uniref:Uncharacterized protein n=1 Tax=Gimesia fumaroli TaxID=2527976 RepID=A0A518I8U4_9PLAN|nr:hypothetical protein [Gimesia fumaroli]QDV49521.1 hypothetical protein Enr17x_15400 [Gimesia fumaroli]
MGHLVPFVGIAVITAAPNWEVYQYILGLIAVCEWGNDCKYYKRLCQVAAECLPVPESTGVYDVLTADEPPTEEQGRRVALILAKRAVELHWEL